MEKEEILSNLNERLQGEGINTSSFQRTFGDYVEANLPDEGTEPDESYWMKHTKILKSISGQFSHDLAEALKKQAPQPAIEEKPQIKTDPAEKPNKEVDELREMVAKLISRLDEKESQQTQEQLMSKVKSEMKKQGATDDYVLRQTLRGVTFDPKKSVAVLAKEMLSAYDSELTACRGKGAAPRSGANNGGADNKPFNDFFAKKKAREGRGGSKTT